MEILLFGHPKSQTTRQAKRWFSERGVPVHERDLRKRPASPGELRKWVDKLGVDGVLDTESKVYREQGLQYLGLDDEAWIGRFVESPLLMRLPLVRCGNAVAAGEDPAAWARLAKAANGES